MDLFRSSINRQINKLAAKRWVLCKYGLALQQYSAASFYGFGSGLKNIAKQLFLLFNCISGKAAVLASMDGLSYC